MKFAAKLSEVPNFGKKVVTVDGKEILLVNAKGKIYAFENECPHQGAPLTAAVIKESYIACPRHGYRFSLHDGSCAEYPQFLLHTFKTEISGDDILVETA